MHLLGLLRGRCSPPIVRRLLGALFLLGAAGVLAAGSFSAGASPGDHQGPPGSVSSSSAPVWVEPRPTASEPEVAAPESVAAAIALPTVAPTAVPSAPTVLPTAVVPDLKASPPPPDPQLPAWASNTKDTSLWSGPTGGNEFTKVPAGATFRVMERQAGRFRVYYPGDRQKRAPGEAWVDAADLAPAGWPHWVRLRQSGRILASPAGDAAAVVSLRAGSFLEVVGNARGSWAHVFMLGDGRSGPYEGWLEAEPAVPIAGPDVISTFALGHDAYEAGGPEVWIKVPYRSQLDGSAFAAANCGPTTINMVLEAYGYKIGQPALRKEILSYQPDEDCDDCGVYIQNLAGALSRRGLQVDGLGTGEPETFHRWTIDELRSALRDGHPVVAEVYYRGLPARSNSAYYGDHYIVLTGLLGDRFVFNDPIDAEGPGYSRLISASALDYAMSESDFPYAAFSVAH